MVSTLMSRAMWGLSLFWLFTLATGISPAVGHVLSLAGPIVAFEDIVELTNGEVLKGDVVEIRKTAKQVKLQLNSGETKVLAYAKIHAVTYRGKRFVITPMSDQGDSAGGHREANNSNAKTRRETEQAMDQAIDQTGRTPPDWFADTPMNYPDSLNLAWPLNASGGWNNQKNVGQFLWDVVYPNEGRWKSGIKLIHHCLELHKDDPKRLKRDMDTLGNMYFVLLQDYHRAAFWYQKTKPSRSTVPSVRLAECYWRLGDEKRALDLLKSNRLPVEAIKLYGDMKQLDEVERLTRAFEKSRANNEAWLAAGDAYRSNGQLETAIEYYQKVVDNDQARNAEYLRRFHQRASAGIESIRLLTQSRPQEILDGTYTADSVGYNGQLSLKVTVKEGRITDLAVTKHREKQFYAALNETPRKIIQQQSLEGIDGTSGATITSQAIVHATAKALADAPRK